MSIGFRSPRHRPVAAQCDLAPAAAQTKNPIDQRAMLDLSPIFDSALDRRVNEGGAIYHAPERRENRRHELRAR